MDELAVSLVEKALEKIRESQRSGPMHAPPQVALDALASPVQRAPVMDAPRPHAPARIIPINRNALRAAGLLPPEHQERQFQQQFRQIKRPLIASAIGRGGTKLPNGHLIVMASAMPGEGKTFTAVNLAFSIAREKDVRVLLVDADIPKPQISKLFGVSSARGLLDVLQDAALEVESLILPTDVPGLSILPAGRHVDNATELLTSQRMRELVTRIGANDPQRIALFDAPPILLTTEAQALAEVAGQVVVVVRAEVTLQQVVLDALSYLEGKSVALVLNQSTSTTPTGYYFYDYGDAAKPTDTDVAQA